MLEHVFDLESFSYINKYSKTEILSFLLLTQLIGNRTLSVVQIRGNRARNFKSVERVDPITP